LKSFRKNIFLKIIIVSILALAMIFMAACSTAVASVNGIEVTQEEVDEYINFILSQDPEGGEYLTDEDLKELEINIIDSLLVVKLLEQYAGENNITASQEEIDLQMDSIITSYGSESAFEADLKEKNVKKSFLENELKNQILRNKIYAEATMEVIVTEEQAKQYYDENLDIQFTIPERIRVSHILSIFPWVEDDSIEENDQDKEEAKDKIEFVQEQLEKGAEFGDMAREFSDDTSNSADGGDLGFITRGQMVEEFEDVAFALEINEVSSIVETEFGYHLIKVFDREEEGAQEFEDVKDDITAYLAELNKLEKWEEFIMSLIDDAEIAYLTDTEGTLNGFLEEEGSQEDEGQAGGEDEESAEDQLLDDESLEDFVEEE
jgi:parvulin-like peptidyl-prolyl isomerase